MASVEALRDGENEAEDRKVILIVEDEFLLRWPTAEYLRDVGYRVIEAATAEEAMTVLSSGAHIDIVFSDINLRGELTGHLLASWMERHRPELAVLMSSANRDASASIVLGAKREFIPKPYSLADIDRRIRGLLSVR